MFLIGKARLLKRIDDLENRIRYFEIEEAKKDIEERLEELKTTDPDYVKGRAEGFMRIADSLHKKYGNFLYRKRDFIKEGKYYLEITHLTGYRDNEIVFQFVLPKALDVKK